MTPNEARTTAPSRPTTLPPITGVDSRRPTVARYSFAPDARKLRQLLTDVERRIPYPDTNVQRRVRLLVGQIVARMIGASECEIEIAVEVKPDSVRIDVWQNTPAPCDFFDKLDEAIFLDLATAWGRDRRRPCGAWFEVA
jgi:hypothetical protein